MPGAIIRGELQAIRIGRYCFIGEGTVIRPAYRQAWTKHALFFCCFFAWQAGCEYPRLGILSAATKSTAVNTSSRHSSCSLSVPRSGTHWGHRSTTVCLFVSFPSILVTVPPIKARRVLHFAACSGDITLQRTFFRLSKLTGVTQEGANTRDFLFSLCFLCCPHLLLRCLPPFLFARRVQPSLPSSTMKSNVVRYALSTMLVACRYVFV